MNKIEEYIKYTFKNKDLLKQALTHKSATGLTNNERLEFLGDAVLKLAISEYLYTTRNEMNEGEMTKIRASVISDNTLANVAKRINIGDYMSCSGAEKKSGGCNKKSIIGDALEAIFGAIYLDSGLIDATNAIVLLLKQEINNLEENGLTDYKSTLQEITQKAKINLPKYNIEKETGPEHDKNFHVSCSVKIKDATILGNGVGKNKKTAEQDCAKEILAKLDE